MRTGVREALEAAGGITLIEGDSAARETVERVRALVRSGERVFVFLDSDHSRAHVAAELEAYAPLGARSFIRGGGHQPRRTERHAKRRSGVGNR